MEDNININMNMNVNSGTSNYANNMYQEDDSDSLPSNIPKTSISDNTYSDFYKICRSYYKELKRTIKDESKAMIKISKDDAIVLNDLVKEIHAYSNALMKNNFTKEALKILDLGLKIVDFMIRLFNALADKDDKDEKQRAGLSPQVSYPLTLKLFLLETKFDVSFRHESNYMEAEKIIEEVIKIQNILQLSYYHLGCSKFYLALIKFYLNDLKTCEAITLEALKNFERTIGTHPFTQEVNTTSGGCLENKEVREDSYYFENRITRKMSNILEFLAELYDLKKDYVNVVAYYEKAYYLNLGRFGPKNVNTEYFKIKLEIVHEQIQNGTCVPHFGNYQKITNLTNLHITNNSKQSIPNASIQRDTIGNPNTNAFKGNNNNNNSKSISGKTSNNMTESTGKNIIYKGRADTFKFAVPFSNLYDPLLISIYENTGDESWSNDISLQSEAFVGNLLIDKNGVFKFLKMFEKFSNNLIYIEGNLMKIISTISLEDGIILMNDAMLRNSLINCNTMTAQIQHPPLQYPKIERKGNK